MQRNKIYREWRIGSQRPAMAVNSQRTVQLTIKVVCLAAECVCVAFPFLPTFFLHFKCQFIVYYVYLKMGICVGWHLAYSQRIVESLALAIDFGLPINDSTYI